MSDINTLFFELIQVAIGKRTKLSRFPSEIEWKVLFDMAVKQSLVGVCFSCLHILGADSDDGFAKIGMSEELFFNWMSMAAQISIKNDAMNEYTKTALAHFRKEGFACTALKGQGVAALYGSLHEFRQSGDVDVWVAGGRKTLYVKSVGAFGKLHGLTYHHIHYPMFNDCEVEVHIWPAFLTNPLDNRKLHTFFKRYEPAVGCNDTPSLAFNRVFILLHCYEHFCGHGVGMRQIMDYYFVLMQGFNQEERIQSMQWIERLGMKRFASALMWLYIMVFQMPESYCICEPNEVNGRFLLEEVMQSGNMGHQDERVNHKKLQSAIGRYTHNIKRDWKIVKICPRYAAWEPVWGIYQFIWVRLTGLKYNR